MKIREIYETYRIMPNLQLHQLRVAAVARTIARARMIDPESVTIAGLLHDMGNIMKSDLTVFPAEFYGSEGIEYWQRVKEETGARYGADVRTATEAIALEIGVNEEVIGLINDMGFSKAEQIFTQGTLPLQIIEYADQRVAPYGIVSMDERLREGHERYKRRNNSDYGLSGDDVFGKNVSILHELEARLFEGLPVRPEDLNDQSLRSEIEALRDYVIA